MGTVFPGATNYTRYYTENFSIIDIHAMTHNWCTAIKVIHLTVNNIVSIDAHSKITTIKVHTAWNVFWFPYSTG